MIRYLKFNEKICADSWLVEYTIFCSIVLSYFIMLCFNIRISIGFFYYIQV